MTNLHRVKALRMKGGRVLSGRRLDVPGVEFCQSMGESVIGRRVPLDVTAPEPHGSEESQRNGAAHPFYWAPFVFFGAD
jgi:hypothetical protein